MLAWQDEPSNIGAAVEVNPYLQQEKPVLGPPLPKEQLYDHKFGLPIVGRKLDYGQLLQEIRLENVEAIKHFSRQQDKATRLAREHCLVIFKDGSLAQSYIPLQDYRVAYAAQNHNVATTILEDTQPPTPSWLVNFRLSAKATRAIVGIAPFAAIAGVWGLAQIAEWRKVHPASCILTCVQCPEVCPT